MTIINLIRGKYKNETLLQLIIQFIYLNICLCIYRIISNIIFGIYGNWTVLHFIIQLIVFKVCSCIYRLCSDRKWGNMNTGQYDS
jgi:hypothetical protein